MLTAPVHTAVVQAISPLPKKILQCCLPLRGLPGLTADPLPPLSMLTAPCHRAVLTADISTLVTGHRVPGSSE